MTGHLEQLLFVRHGESGHHVEGLTGGWTNTPLTDRGRRQVAALGRHLAESIADRDFRLYTSDLLRAAQTAEILGDALGISPIALPGLREINNGAAAGLTQDEALLIARPEPPGRDVDWQPYEGAETLRDVAVRLKDTYEAIADDAGGRAMVVGHGLSGQELIRAWLGLAVEVPIAFRLAPASYTELVINRWGEREIAHLSRTIAVTQPGHR